MKKIKNFINKAYDKKIDGRGLAIFRIVYCVVLLLEIAHMFFFKELIFDKTPFLNPSEIDFSYPILIWFFSVLLILFGLFTRFSTILNYLMSLILIGSMRGFEYHVFYAYMGINFIFILMPISKCFSIDRLLLKLKYSNTTFQYTPPNKVRQIYYFLPVFVAIGLIYFDSIFIKTTAFSWRNGLGVWMPSSLPMMTHLNTSFILNQKWIMLFLGYLTLVFETVFIFLFFRKKLRVLMFLIGVGLHFGILLVFPIPLFALTYISIYLLLIPISFWDYVFKSKKSYKKKLSVFYDAECPLCVRTKLVVTHFDSRNRIEFKTVQSDSINNSALKKYDKENLLSDIHCVDQKGKVRKGIDTYIKILNLIWWTRPISLFLRLPGIYQLAKKLYEFIAVNRNTKRCTEDNCGYNPPNIINNDTLKILKNFTISDLKKYVLVLILISFCTFQSLAIYKSPMVRNLKLRIAYADTTVDKVIMRISTSILNKSKVFFGITPHAVFIDNIHYKNYNHIIAIVHRDQNGSEKWLPITNKDGYVDTYAYGTNWAFYGFRVNSANINPESLISGIERYTAFWAHKNQINLEDAKFIIKVKKIDSPKEWKKDFLNKQIDKPWQDGGYVLWKDKEMSSFVYDIEAI